MPRSSSLRATPQKDGAAHRPAIPHVAYSSIEREVFFCLGETLAIWFLEPLQDLTLFPSVFVARPFSLSLSLSLFLSLLVSGCLWKLRTFWFGFPLAFRGCIAHPRLRRLL